MVVVVIVVVVGGGGGLAGWLLRVRARASGGGKT